MAVCVNLILILTFVIDRIFKIYSLDITDSAALGPLTLVLHKNYGFMLGSLQDIPIFARIMGMAIWGSVIVFAYYFLIQFLPIRRKALQFGLAIFTASAIANIVDRVYYGYVVDSLLLQFGSYHTGIFNLADAFQWVGVVLIFYSLVIDGTKLWPATERRGGFNWLKPEFQLRLSLTFATLGLLISLSISFFSYGYMKWSANAFSDQHFSFYLSSASGLTLLLTFFMFFFGRKLSFKIVGPIFSFERYLDNILLGQATEFKLRDQDESFHFQTLATQFQNLVIQTSGINPEPLPSGYLAPGFHAMTYNNKSVRLEAYRGKKLWLCLYRYATCLLCIEHLAEVTRRYPELKSKNLDVIAVFESSPENFVDQDTQLTKEILKSVPFALISDPDKSIYKAYRARKSWGSVFKMSVVKTALRAYKKGYRNGVTDGEIDQIPLHVLIDEQGKVYKSFSGQSVDEHISWSEIDRFLK